MPSHAAEHHKLAAIMATDMVDHCHCLFIAGRYDEALVEVDKALKLSPDFLVAYLRRGRLFLVQKRIPEAIAEFEKVPRIFWPTRTRCVVSSRRPRPVWR